MADADRLAAALRYIDEQQPADPLARLKADPIGALRSAFERKVDPIINNARRTFATGGGVGDILRAYGEAGAPANAAMLRGMGTPYQEPTPVNAPPSMAPNTSYGNLGDASAQMAGGMIGDPLNAIPLAGPAARGAIAAGKAAAPAGRYAGEQLARGLEAHLMRSGGILSAAPNPEKVNLLPQLGDFPSTTVGRIKNTTNAAGGYSVNLGTGETPTSGLMMGKYSNEDPRNTIGALTNALIKEHARKNTKALGEQENFLGTWLNADEANKAYLDVSRRFNEDEIRAATKFGEATRQKAGYNVNTGETFPVGNVSEWLSSPEFGERLDAMGRVGAEHMGGKAWWDLRGGPIDETYAMNSTDPIMLKKVAGMIASTSPKNSPEQNLALASEYIRRVIKKEPIAQPDFRIPPDATFFAPGKMMGMETTKVPNLTKSYVGDIDRLRKDKVNDMAHALMGEDVGVYDRRYAKIGDNPSKGVYMDISKDQLAGAMDGSPEAYAHVENAVREGAKRANKSLSVFSSEVWEGIGETIKKHGELFGVKHDASKIPESSFGFNELFPKMVAAKAKALGISPEAFRIKLGKGDAELLSTLLATPVGMLAYEQYQRDQAGD